MSERDVELTQWAQYGGCGAKVPPNMLEQALCTLPRIEYPEVLSDFGHSEDCGVYRLSENQALVQTVDFFPPMCDDPFTFGRIAACNSLSDVYAMGAQPISAVSIACFPHEQLDMKYLTQILEGALDALKEARCALLGGHTIRDSSLTFGLAVNGLVDPSVMWSNNTWKEDHVLILTKPIGVGVINQAMKAELATAEQAHTALNSMATLNKKAKEVLSQYEVSACTDVTGFGLAGHLIEMTIDNPIGAVLETSLIPIIDGVLDYIAMGLIPMGAYTNIDSRASLISNFDEVDENMKYLLFDPQTSGGLLAAVPKEVEQEVLEALHTKGVDATTIGYTDSSFEGIRIN